MEVSADTGPARADKIVRPKLRPVGGASGGGGGGEGAARGYGSVGAAVSEPLGKGKGAAGLGPPAEVKAAAEAALERALLQATETGALPAGVRANTTHHTATK